MQSSSDEGRQAVRDSERAEEAGESGRLVGLDDLSRPVRAELAVRSNLPTPAHRCRPVHAQPGSAPAVTGAGPGPGPAFRFSALQLSRTGARAVAFASAAGIRPCPVTAVKTSEALAVVFQRPDCACAWCDAFRCIVQAWLFQAFVTVSEISTRCFADQIRIFCYFFYKC